MIVKIAIIVSSIDGADLWFTPITSVTHHSLFDQDCAASTRSSLFFKPRSRSQL
ncbi:hypothetical protein [Tychonema sp. BBK16]|uniref:hypothetical protein n=1 Tax=Tychonema sp. BBK16 TaxID=2699888 RepID=UPI0038D28EC2